jgi:tetratricopeptide (TPR) repeat protein
MRHFTIPLASGIATVVLMAGCAMNHDTGAAANDQTPGHESAETHPNAPLTSNTHFAAGQVAESQGDMQRALTQYQAACDLDPTASVPLMRMGMIYTRTGQFDRAVEIWHRYIKATREDAAGYCDLGYTLELAGRVSEAQTAYSTAIAKSPMNETARVDYGLMLARQGRTSEAILQWNTVLTPAEVHYNLASVLESQGKKTQAKAEYREALKIDPDMTDAQSRLAGLDTN